MSGYLTRAELREELDSRGYVRRAELREELDVRDKRFEAIDKRFDGIDRRFDDFEQRMIHSMGQMAVAIGEEVGRQLRASHHGLRTELRAELGRDLSTQILASEERLGRELTIRIAASEERIRGEIRALDDQYRDLPKRVTALEEHTGLKR